MSEWCYIGKTRFTALEFEIASPLTVQVATEKSS